MRMRNEVGIALDHCVKTWNRSVGLPASPHSEGSQVLINMALFIFFQCLTCEGCCLLTCGQIPLAGAMGSKKWWLAMGLKCALFCMACSC
jgi:hypothetical protein